MTSVEEWMTNNAGQWNWVAKFLHQQFIEGQFSHIQGPARFDDEWYSGIDGLRHIVDDCDPPPLHSLTS